MPAFDAQSAGTGSGSGTTVAHTAGAAGYYVVCWLFHRYLSMTSVSVTYDGNAMTLLADSGYAASGNITRVLVYGYASSGAGAKNAISAWTGTTAYQMVVQTFSDAAFDDFAVGADETSQYDITVNSEDGGLGIGGFASAYGMEGVHAERYDATAEPYGLIDELAASGATVTLSATGSSWSGSRQAAISLSSPPVTFIPKTQFFLSMAGLLVPAALGRIVAAHA